VPQLSSLEWFFHLVPGEQRGIGSSSIRTCEAIADLTGAIMLPALKLILFVWLFPVGFGALLVLCSRIAGSSPIAFRGPGADPIRLIAAAMVTHADGYAERDAALLMLEQKPRNCSQRTRSRRINVGADKAYDTKNFVTTVRELTVTPHVTKNEIGLSTRAVQGSIPDRT
jgi:hypothetical protein